MQFIKHAGLSARQFDISIGASNGYTLRMSKNKASVGSDVIENILKTYPDLNVVWLLTGEGPMLKSQHNQDLADFDKLPYGKRMEIDRIIDAKIRERQEEQRQELLIEIRHELGKSLEG
ncbi:hypothetical protein [Robiginitalea marina]|uniref:HTH cro/C1-type domain-containing protein n=1 Tax=Robiginitalea marina TaxID=2954105 RepID=A0ABT1AWK7_9FLAO|nr:hypothetical protein [Robiginitalea marina]MCO5723583.1 hypothetical protein [Robiginitalea marina]